jgi:hypothetical protein
MKCEGVDATEGVDKKMQCWRKLQCKTVSMINLEDLE